MSGIGDIASGPAVAPAVRLRVALPFIVVTLIWSSTWLVIRDQLGVVPPSWSIAYRFLIACGAMLAFAVVRRDRLAIGRRGHGLAALIGGLLFALNFNFVYRAEGEIASGLVAILFALLIVPNALLGRIFLGQRLSARFVAGSGIAMLGLALLFAHEFRGGGPAPHAVLLGIMFTLLAVMAASVANVLQGTALARTLPSASLLGLAMLYGALLNIGFAWITTGLPVFDPRAGYWLGTLYLGLIASALAFPLYMGVIRAIGPGRAAYSSVLTPILAMLLSTLFEGYRWSWPAVAGVALAIGGLAVALSARSPAR